MTSSLSQVGSIHIDFGFRELRAVSRETVQSLEWSQVWGGVKYAVLLQFTWPCDPLLESTSQGWHLQLPNCVIFSVWHVVQPKQAQAYVRSRGLGAGRQYKSETEPPLPCAFLPDCGPWMDLSGREMKAWQRNVVKDCVSAPWCPATGLNSWALS